MLDLGIAHYHIVGAVSLIISQRLVRKLCPECKLIDTNITDGQRKGLGLPEKANIYMANKNGCPVCFGGYRDRTGIYEVMVLSHTLKQFITEHYDTEKLLIQAQKEGLLSLKQHALSKVAQGITSLEEIYRVVDI